MPSHPHIHYLRRQDIDDMKWDECIQNSPNGLIYGRTFFLDTMTRGQWDALVWGDYQAVMPLTWRKRFGFFYLYQPFFTAVLGVMGKDTTHQPVDSFLAAIPSKFRLWDFHLNESNHISNHLPVKNTKRINYLLPLHQPYDAIRENYSRLARRMLKKTTGLSVDRTSQPSAIIDLYRDMYSAAHPDITGEDYQRLKNCADQASKNGYVSTWLARSTDGSIQAFYLAFADRRFVYSVMGGSTAEGKVSGAFYLLTDALIRAYAGQDKTFRFEGSDIPGIAFFNSQFGPAQVHYPHITLNRLPFPVNLFKRV